MKQLSLDFTPRFSKRMSFFSRKGLTGTFTSIGGEFGMFSGEKKQLYYKGKGLVFDGFREYTPFDDAKMIDWKASLRANKKLVRKYSEEKNKNIIFFFDVSSSMSYSSHFKLKNEYAAELIASLAYSYLNTGDSVGLVMFTDRLVHRRDVSVGEGHWLKLCDDLSNPNHYEGQFNFTRAARELLSYLKIEAVLVLVTDFIGVENEGEWHKVYEVMATRFELLTIVIRDPFDNALPKGLGNVTLSNPFGGENVVVNLDAIREEYNRRNAAFLETVKHFTEKLGGDLIILTTDKDFTTPMLNFFSMREEIWS